MNQYTDPFEAPKITAWDIRKKAKRTLSREERAGLMAFFRFRRRPESPYDDDLYHRFGEGQQGFTWATQWKIINGVDRFGARPKSSYRESNI